MNHSPSRFRTVLEERGFILVYTLSLPEIMAALGQDVPSGPFQPIFFTSDVGQPRITIAVDEYGHMWVVFNEHLDLSDLGFDDTSDLFPQVQLRKDTRTIN